MSILLLFWFLGQLWGANFSLVLSIACGGGIIFENEFYKLLLVSTGFFFPGWRRLPHWGHYYGCELPTPHWLLVSSKALSMYETLHLIGLFQSSEFKLLPLGFKKKFSCFVFLGSKSISNGVEYVILQSKIGWKEKTKCAGLAEENGFGSTHTHSLQWIVNGTRMISTIKQSVINMIYLLLSVSDWSIS